MVLVHLHDRFLLLLGIILVLLLKRLKFWLETLHFHARTHRPLIQGPEH